MGVDGAGERGDRSFYELDLGVPSGNAKPAKCLRPFYFDEAEWISCEAVM